MPKVHAPLSTVDLQTKSRDVPVDQRVMLLRLYFECHSNAAATARLYNNTHCTLRPVNPQYVLQLVKKFNKTGSVCNAKRTGRPRTTTDEISAGVVVEEVRQNSHLSIQRIAQHCATTPYAVHRILKEREFRRYGALQVQVLKPDDSVNRLTFARLYLNTLDVHSIMFTDEAIFRLHGTQKRHVWATNNPRQCIASRVQHGTQVMAWAGLTSRTIIGPFFFSQNVTASSYKEMLQTWVIPRLHAEGLLSTVWWQQDGAPAHSARTVSQFLDDTFGHRWIGRGGPLEWPARSPDMNPLDFFLWGYLKRRVYKVKPTCVEELK
ncbi:unnamed protein product, partial [Dicrocoelium dendriticum]